MLSHSQSSYSLEEISSEDLGAVGFERISSANDSLPLYKKTIWLKILLKYRDLLQGHLYDLGCGESPYKDYFLQQAEQYIGVDWQGSPHKTQETLLADLNENLPIGDNVADTVVSLSVLEHLYNPQSMVDEAFRILNSNGHLVMQMPWQWTIHEAPHDYSRYTPFALTRFLENAGFVDIHIEAQAGFFTTMILKWNYFTARFVSKNKIHHKFFKLCLLPFWYFGQKLAPHLDKLDKNWSAETIGFFVTARKP